MSIQLKLDGFEQLLKEIEKAEGNVEQATKKCLNKSALIMQDELKAQMHKADKQGHWGDLIASMPPPKIESDYGEISAHVGWKKGTYNPKSPSDAYKVVFLNYGTPHRQEHGKVKARGFIQKAKKKAKPKIQAQQEQTFKEILKGLKK